jgi:hypothetical protein
MKKIFISLILLTSINLNLVSMPVDASKQTRPQEFTSKALKGATCATVSLASIAVTVAAAIYFSSHPELIGQLPAFVKDNTERVTKLVNQLPNTVKKYSPYVDKVTMIKNGWKGFKNGMEFTKHGTNIAKTKIQKYASMIPLLNLVKAKTQNTEKYSHNDCNDAQKKEANFAQTKTSKALAEIQKIDWVLVANALKITTYSAATALSLGVILATTIYICNHTAVGDIVPTFFKSNINSIFSLALTLAPIFKHAKINVVEDIKPETLTHQNATVIA